MKTKLSYTISALVAVILLCFSSMPAVALDDEDEFPGPAFYGLIPLKIEKISIFVSEDKIQYSYAIMNHSDRNVRVPFTFAILPYEWTGTHRDIYKNGYRSMNVTVDGKKVEMEKTVQAFVNGKDIAPLLLELNIDPVFEGVIAFSKEYQDIIKANPELTAHGYL